MVKKRWVRGTEFSMKRKKFLLSKNDKKFYKQYTQQWDLLIEKIILKGS